MNVLLTGASGRIGANIALQLLQAGHKVLAAVRPGSDRVGKLQSLQEKFGSLLQIKVCDLSDRKGLEMLAHESEAVIHNGAHLYSGDTYAQFDNTLGSTVALLEAVRERNDLKRFVFISSTSVYEGPTVRETPQAEHESTWQLLGGAYAVSKIAGESFCYLFHHRWDVPVVSLRFPLVFAGKELLNPDVENSIFGVAGQLKRLEGRSLNEAESAMAQQLESLQTRGIKLAIPLNRDGRPHRRHWCDVRDAARGTLLALTEPGAVGHSLNIMSQPFDFAVAAQTLAELSGWTAEPLTAAEQYDYTFDQTLAKETIGFESRFDTRQMITDAYRHLQGEDIGVIARD